MSNATQNFVTKCKHFWDEADKDGNSCLSIGEMTKMIRAVSKVELTDAEIAVS